MHRGIGRFGVALAFAAALTTGAIAQTPPVPVPDPAPALPASYGNLLSVVFSGNQTIIGQTIDYPAEGVVEITHAVVTIPPGGETGWHSHSVPLYGFILEGVATIDYGPAGIRTAPAGTGFLEAIDWPHNARNLGDGPLRILAIYLGVEGVANADPADAPL